MLVLAFVACNYIQWLFGSAACVEHYRREFRDRWYTGDPPVIVVDRRPDALLVAVNWSSTVEPVSALPSCRDVQLTAARMVPGAATTAQPAR